MQAFEIRYIPAQEFERIKLVECAPAIKNTLLADMCRANALATVKYAGSGHLGSSFSSLDIVTFLYYSQMNTVQLGYDHPDRDIYFSSKGHDAPGHYAVLYALGIIPESMFINLRRINGTHGHPDVSIPGIEANSGSLGMGISKAKGIAYAKKLEGRGGHVYVMTGDGELQEGQIWESLQTTAHQGINDITVMVDYNKIQSDKPVEKIIGIEPLQEKLTAFGWDVERCNGHNFDELSVVFSYFQKVKDKPKVLIADTIKGKGVSFMEGPAALDNGGGLYRWHAGAPDDDKFEEGFTELIERINNCLMSIGLSYITLKLIETREKKRIRMRDTSEKVVRAFDEALVECGKKNPQVVVLDADLSADCGLRNFEARFPARFIENGIAEQDMVSMAGGLALQGYLPIVNSFGVFLASRANEQIYNNSTEQTKIIYVCHYAGLIPAGPGKSHQSLRDISLFSSLPNCVILEPCNSIETKLSLEWCVYQSVENCLLRLVISPSPRIITLPKDYNFEFSKGTVLRDGKDAAIFCYGPVMLHEALLASELLEKEAFSLKVINTPWLNRVDPIWFEGVVKDCKIIYSLDNHFTCGGLGDYLLNLIATSEKLSSIKFKKFAVEGYPACGTPQEVLHYHRLDGQSLAEQIISIKK